MIEINLSIAGLRTLVVKSRFGSSPIHILGLMVAPYQRIPIVLILFSAGMNHKVSWICNTCGYKWKAAISSRTKGHGCRKCAIKKRYRT